MVPGSSTALLCLRISPFFELSAPLACRLHKKPLEVALFLLLWVRKQGKALNLTAPRNLRMHNNDSYPGSIAMAKIDGEAIRRLRETKGLTQLYVATAVGVTTDTISRWENRRYPSIKQENAARLAEALEVPVSAILDAQAPEETTAPEIMPEAGRKPRRGLALWLSSVALLLLAAGLVAWLLSPAPEHSPFEAVRILPSHAPPGQTFPVVLRLTAGSKHPFPLILKEVLPASSTPLQGEPAFTSIDREGKVVKWISRAGREPVVFAYLAQTPSQAEMGETLHFQGSVTLRQELDATIDITGSLSLEVSPYHWADLNRDGRIDDEEILSVYDTFSLLDDHAFNRQLIEDIWAAEGYRWDEDTGSYEIL
jgi:transcriptional regulator with XRE-family HTH domain